MKMRLLFTTQPALGHLHPLVPIARAAQRTGHFVVFGVAPSFCPILAKLGFEARAAGADYTDPEVASIRSEGRKYPDLNDQMAWVVGKLFAGILAQRMAPDLLSIAEEWKPDVLVTEVSEFASWVVAERQQLPRAVIPFGQYSERANRMRELRAGPALEALRRQVQLPPDPELKTLEPKMTLIFAPPSYQDPTVPLAPTVHFLRPTLFDQSGDEKVPDWVRKPRDRPLVYGTVGTAFNTTPGILESIVEAAAGEAFDLIVTVGRDRDPALLGSLPANVRVERYIPQSLLLPWCNAVVAHGGYNTVIGSLCHGLPMVLIPLGADQPVHAKRCVELDVAVVIDRDALNPTAIRNAVNHILRTPSYRERATALKTEIETLPSMEHAVRLLEQLAKPK
jgi:MGT family glycosyltransferase